jgi:Ser/Thr protein kinase RdoA (MazF antagonist)
MVKRYAAEFDRSSLDKLPTSVIHGDANDYNVLVDPLAPGVTGLIDLGDMVHSYTVGDLAVAIAYVVLDKPDPIAVATNVVAGYTDQRALNEAELGVIWRLVLLRLCMSMCLAHAQQQTRPDNEYLGISQRLIRESLPGLIAIDPRAAADRFRRA